MSAASASAAPSGQTEIGAELQANQRRGE